MSSEPRKATDVLLDIESKINTLLGIVQSQDLVIKVLSNKLNEVMAKLDKQQATPPKIVVETVQSPHPQKANLPPGFVQLPGGEPERNVPFVAETNLPQTDFPQGFRRNSRPETFAKPMPGEVVRMPMQLPNMPQVPVSAPNGPPPGRGPGSEVPTLPTKPQASPKTKGGAVMPVPQQQAPADDSIPPFPSYGEQNQIPVSQRCVDKNGKSIFLAGVSIVNVDTGQPVYQGRTSGTGKWAAPLSVGSYRVTVSKQGSSIREKIEAVQDVHVDGSKSPLDLPMMIIK
jgi:hypothetical protein